MSNLNIIQAWKDPEYRQSLPEEQRAKLPAHPAGAIEFRIQKFQEAMQYPGHNHYSPCHKCGSSGP
jgi:mersacidin/lichenicidin family type 2 lantibiotic